MRIGAIGALLALAACTVGGQEDDIACTKAGRSGSYLVQYAVLMSTCGAIGSELIRFENGAIVPDDETTCTYGVPSFRNGDCSATLRSVCAVGTGTSTTDIDLTQVDDEGAELSGSAAVRLVDANGNQTCSGTYRVTAVRQSS